MRLELPQPAMAQAGTEAGAFRVTALDDCAGLSAHLGAWEDLAAEASEPNVFHEPWMLLPAIESFASGIPLRLVLVYADSPGSPSRLCGLFPFERMTRYRNFLPLPHWRLWTHKHCFLGTPLVRSGAERGCLQALLDWCARSDPAMPLVDWGEIAADGPLYGALSDVLAAGRRRAFVVHRAARAVLRPRRNAQAYLAEVLPGVKRKEFRRLRRRLSERGEIEYAELETPSEADRWIHEFLALERRGWKGRGGSALDANAANRRFFLGMAGEAARRGRLMMASLRVGGRLVAMKCSLRARRCAFAFKIAYDEEFARYSPGVLLELESLERFHAQQELQWVDSCADPDHFMANRLWPDRRSFASLMTSSGTAQGELALAMLPLLHRAYRRLKQPALRLHRAFARLAAKRSMQAPGDARQAPGLLSR